MNYPIFLVSIIIMCACGNTDREMLPTELTLDTATTYNAMVAGFDEQMLLETVEEPDANGALGRNKDGYFHVRFQLNMKKLTDAAVALKRTDALEAYLQTLRYALRHQEANGGFELVIPQELQDNAEVPDPSPGDLASGTAFFGYSLGLSLVTLDQSEWAQQSEETLAYRNEIQKYRPMVASILEYLEANRHLLEQVDAEAPNRLLFNGIAFYTLGKHLDDTEAMAIGLDFAENAMDQVDKESGYFIEGGGWDSSYNGVALKLGLELYTLLDNSEIKQRLQQILIRAMQWQQSRILNSGEISTEGNTRVFQGGESFLGNEKMVDVEKSVRALFYFSFLTNQPAYTELAHKVLDFYR